MKPCSWHWGWVPALAAAKCQLNGLVSCKAVTVSHKWRVFWSCSTPRNTRVAPALKRVKFCGCRVTLSPSRWCHDSKVVISVMSVMCHDSNAVISIFVLVVSFAQNSSKTLFLYSIRLLLRWRHWLLSSQTTMLLPSTQRMAVSHLDWQMLVNMCTTFDII